MKLDQLVNIYETLSLQSLSALAEVYTPDAHFKDPFNDVRGLPAIEGIFRHMFTQVAAPRFVVRERVAGESTAFLIWDFHFTRGGKPMIIHGSSHLKFDASGRAFEHRDYWDAAEELYAHLPLIGALMLFLQRRLAARHR